MNPLIRGPRTTPALSSMHPALLATLTACSLDAAAARAATIDAVSRASGGLLDATAPDLAGVLSDALTGVVEAIGYGYGCAVLPGLVLVAVLVPMRRHAESADAGGQTGAAADPSRHQAGAVR